MIRSGLLPACQEGKYLAAKSFNSAGTAGGSAFSRAGWRSGDCSRAMTSPAVETAATASKAMSTIRHGVDWRVTFIPTELVPASSCDMIGVLGDRCPDSPSLPELAICREADFRLAGAATRDGDAQLAGGDAVLAHLQDDGGAGGQIAAGAVRLHFHLELPAPLASDSFRWMKLGREVVNAGFHARQVEVKIGACGRQKDGARRAALEFEIAERNLFVFVPFLHPKF